MLLQHFTKMQSRTQKLRRQPNQTSNIFAQVLQMTAAHSTSKQVFIIEKSCSSVQWKLHNLDASYEYFSASLLQNPLKITTPDYPWPCFWRDSHTRLYETWGCKIRNPGSSVCALLRSVSSPHAALKHCCTGLSKINTNYCSPVTEVIKNFTVWLISN